MSKLPIAERFAAFRDWNDREGAFVKEYLLRFSHYVLETTPKIAYDIASVDHAIEWGYAWEAGPFKQMDLLGVDWLRNGFEELGLDEPALLKRATNGFYSADGKSELSLDGDGYQPVKHEADELRLRDLHIVEKSRRCFGDRRRQAACSCSSSRAR